MSSLRWRFPASASLASDSSNVASTSSAVGAVLADKEKYERAAPAAV
jgi:hypothetical protein